MAVVMLMKAFIQVSEYLLSQLFQVSLVMLNLSSLTRPKANVKQSRSNCR